MKFQYILQAMFINTKSAGDRQRPIIAGFARHYMTKSKKRRKTIAVLVKFCRLYMQVQLRYKCTPVIPVDRFSG